MLRYSSNKCVRVPRNWIHYYSDMLSLFLPFLLHSYDVVEYLTPPGYHNRREQIIKMTRSRRKCSATLIVTIKKNSWVQRPQSFFGVQIDCTLRLITYVTSRTKCGEFFSKIICKCIVNLSNYYRCFFATGMVKTHHCY